ncbi:MAG: hypothetical protein FJ137_17130 [Deltaproteobacteria bacterium]|nr:hypothetical protein [Deltaproteobacteria bacterium]
MKDNDPRAVALAALTVRFEEAGVLQVEEIDRVVVACSALWATVAFLARERDRSSGTWRSPRVQLRRYKWRGGRFVVDKHFTLTGRAQADAVGAALAAWFAPGGAGRAPGDDTTPAADDDGDSG